jgi:hypothetical protein
MTDPQTGLAVLAAAIGGKDIIVKVLGRRPSTSAPAFETGPSSAFTTLPTSSAQPRANSRKTSQARRCRLECWPEYFPKVPTPRTQSWQSTLAESLHLRALACHATTGEHSSRPFCRASAPTTSELTMSSTPLCALSTRRTRVPSSRRRAGGSFRHSCRLLGLRRQWHSRPTRISGYW